VLVLKRDAGILKKSESKDQEKRQKEALKKEAEDGVSVLSRKGVKAPRRKRRDEKLGKSLESRGAGTGKSVGKGDRERLRQAEGGARGASLIVMRERKAKRKKERGRGWGEMEGAGVRGEDRKTRKKRPNARVADCCKNPTKMKPCETAILRFWGRDE